MLPFVLLLTACSGSSPRFRSTTGETAGTDEIRFASKIKAEEEREDDRKVDLATFRNEARGGSGNLTPAGIDRDAVLLDVVSYLGTPYLYGGATKNGFDCSGFTSTVYRDAMQISIPRTARDQYRTGSSVDGDGLQFGDLVFFNTTGAGASHVGIYLEDDLFAHSSVSYGVTISSLESTYYRKRFLGAKRVAH